MAGGSNKKVFDDINITPLTDIFLVLLVIMMVVAPLLTFRELNISFSATEASETPPQEEEPKPGHITVTIDETGAFVVADEPKTGDELRHILLEKAKLEDPSLTVETDPKSPFDSMARAMDLAQQSGIIKVAVVETTPPAPEPAPPKPPSKGKK